MTVSEEFNKRKDIFCMKLAKHKVLFKIQLEYLNNAEISPNP